MSIFTKLHSILAEVTLPGSDGLQSPPSSPTHVQPAVVAVAVAAIGIVAFLGFDFYRQKRAERLERAKLERFREKKLRSASMPDGPSTKPHEPHR